MQFYCIILDAELFLKPQRNKQRNSSAESIHRALTMQPSTKCVTDYFRNVPKIEKSFRLTRVVYWSWVWYLADNTSLDHVSTINNGWYRDPTNEQLHPQLVVEDPLPLEFSDIVYCKCKNCAIARCTCKSKQLKCTCACSCSDDICWNPFTTMDDEESG